MMTLQEQITEYQAAIDLVESTEGRGGPLLLDGHLTRIVDQLEPEERPEGMEYPIAAVSPPGAADEDDPTLPSTRAFDPMLNAAFLAAHRRNVDRLKALIA